MNNSERSSESLYRRTLGASYDNLPSVLREFHDRQLGGVAKGVLKITRGRGWMRYIVAAIIGLPKPGTHVPIHLRVEVRGESEVWIRHFGKQRMVTHQWLKDNLLIEAAGPFRIGFKLTSDSTGLKFQFNRCWFLALPIPDFLSPKVNAIVHGYPDRWHVDVSMESPLLGLLSRYEGEVAPE